MNELFGGVYAGRRVLVTGHTGFKGSWLSLWLNALGAQVSGIALPPSTSPNHWRLLKLNIGSELFDIDDAARLNQAVEKQQPEIVFHLAAQPLVLAGYRDPLSTWRTNVMGTAHVLEACRNAESVRAVVVVTTDKCYESREWPWPYRESDSLGGNDPYSASKAAAELLTASYRRSFARPDQLIASARAGNVIGGGDWSDDRLLPDAVRSFAEGKPLVIRNPRAIRPWQHVLESLSGYLLLGQRLLCGDASAADAWNFGPDLRGDASVASVLTHLQSHWPRLNWASQSSEHHETSLLRLDASKARQQLGWRPIWDLEQTLKATAEWYSAYLESGKIISWQQLELYIADASRQQLPWTRT